MKTSNRHLFAASLLVFGGLVLAEAIAKNVPVPAPAVSANIAVCDVQEVFKHYRRAADLSAQRQRREGDDEDQRQKRQANIKNLSLELGGLREGSKQYRTRRAELQHEAANLDSWMKAKNRIALDNYCWDTKEMYKEISDTIAVIAKQKGYDIVLQRPRDMMSRSPEEVVQEIPRLTLLYSSEKLDITGIVLLRLNATYKESKR